MEIYAALKADHKAVKKVLKSLETTTEKSVKRRESLFKQLKLVPHACAEELAFYERFKKSEVKEADALTSKGTKTSYSLRTGRSRHFLGEPLAPRQAVGDPSQKTVISRTFS
jgi:hypothetical protein